MSSFNIKDNTASFNTKLEGDYIDNSILFKTAEGQAFENLKHLTQDNNITTVNPSLQPTYIRNIAKLKNKIKDIIRKPGDLYKNSSI